MPRVSLTCPVPVPVCIVSGMNATHHLLLIVAVGGFVAVYILLCLLGLCHMAALGDRDDR